LAEPSAGCSSRAATKVASSKLIAHEMEADRIQHKVYIFDIDSDELEYTTKTHLKKYYEEKKLDSALCDLRDVKDIRTKVIQAAKFFEYVNVHVRTAR
jgi:hypothetical protein